jgi:hypothetical protein
MSSIAMPLGGILYLALVVVAFLAFTFSLAIVSEIESKHRTSREDRG